MEKESAEVRRWLFRILLFVYDGIMVNASFFLAIIIRFYIGSRFYDDGARYMDMFWEFMPVYTGFCLVVFILFRLYSGVWRYVGVNDVRKLILANCITCIFQIFGSLLIIGRMPISYYGMGAFMQFFFMSVPRIAPRFIIESFGSSGGVGSAQVGRLPMMIVGVGENARIIQNMVRKDKTNLAKPVCLVDYAGGLGSTTFNGLPVVSGKDGMVSAIKKYGVKCVVLSDSKLSDETVEDITKVCEKNDIELRSFSMKVEYRDGGMRLIDILSMMHGPVCIVDEGREELFTTGDDALLRYQHNYVVEKISSGSDAIRVDVRRIKLSQISQDDEWVKKYKEENGGEVSFFV